MLFGKSIRQRTKANGKVMLGRTGQSRALFAQIEQSVERGDGHWHVNKRLQEVEMSENGKGNWKEPRRSTVARALAPQ
jgi:hypothetical protein